MIIHMPERISVFSFFPYWGKLVSKRVSHWKLNNWPKILRKYMMDPISMTVPKFFLFWIFCVKCFQLMHYIHIFIITYAIGERDKICGVVKNSILIQRKFKRQLNRKPSSKNNIKKWHTTAFWWKRYGKPKIQHELRIIFYKILIVL